MILTRKHSSLLCCTSAVCLRVNRPSAEVYFSTKDGALVPVAAGAIARIGLQGR